MKREEIYTLDEELPKRVKARFVSIYSWYIYAWNANNIILGSILDFQFKLDKCFVKPVLTWLS